MKYHLTEIFDIEKLRRLCESFTKLNGTVTAILDLDGNIHVETGWRPICVQFHRVNERTKWRCVESDTTLASQIKQGEKYSIYKCKNGLIDIAMPIIVGDTHVGNFFTGQFLTKKPDLNFFKKQAIEYGFDWKAYSSALKKVPIISEEQMKVTIEFFVQLAETIGNLGLKNLQNIEYSKQLKIEKEKAEKSKYNLRIKNKELKHTIRKISELEKRLQFALTTNHTGAWDLDLKDHSAIRTVEHDKIFGYDTLLPEWTYEMFLEHVIEEDRKSVDKKFKQAIEEKSLWDFECQIRRRDGVIRWIWACGNYQSDEKGNIFRMAGIVQDITERKHIEELIERQYIELKKLNIDKDRFISILAHDLKGPFSSIIGLLNMLIKNISFNNLNEIKDSLLLINEASKRAYNLLDDILLWIRAESGKLPFKPNDLNLANICDEVIENMKSIASEKNIAINSILDNNITIFADSNMLKTILRNLISNAIKFSYENGKIELRADKNESNIIIKVSDNGIGIVPDTKNKLFDMTYIRSTEGTKGEKGTGFGLLICKEFAEKHGGKIWAESEPGKGAIFYFVIPA